MEAETLLVSRSTTIASHVDVYTRLMIQSEFSEVQSTVRDEEYGNVYVVYGRATLRQLVTFARMECRIERENGLLSR